MDVMELVSLVREVYGKGAAVISVHSGEGWVSCLLYESFYLRCGANGDHGTFGASVLVGEYWSGQFFGQSVSLNPDRESIVTSLKLIDRWCRAKLPDEFLKQLADDLANQKP